MRMVLMVLLGWLGLSGPVAALVCLVLSVCKVHEVRLEQQVLLAQQAKRERMERRVRREQMALSDLPVHLGQPELLELLVLRAKQDHLAQ